MGCQNAFARHRQAIRDRCILRISLGEQNENEESPQLAGDRGVCSTRSEASQQQTANQLLDLAGKGDALALRQLKALATKGNLEAAGGLIVAVRIPGLQGDRGGAAELNGVYRYHQNRIGGIDRGRRDGE